VVLHLLLGSFLGNYFSRSGALCQHSLHIKNLQNAPYETKYF
jgi:hypothetical protein